MLMLRMTAMAVVIFLWHSMYQGLIMRLIMWTRIIKGD